MPRPKKQIVDYFPHYCNHKKTMHIIEQRYGNDGYAFWFKLLEMLGETEGHFIDLNDETTWEFLQAKTRLSGIVCAEMLDLLAKLQAINAELWSAKIIWCQNFVDGIAVVYRNRRVSVPEMPVMADNYMSKPRCADVSTFENPQSRVEYSKEEKRRVQINTKRSSKVFADDSLEMQLSVNLKKFILANNPKAKHPENLQNWCAEFDKILRIDGRTYEDVTAVMAYSQKDTFWMANILSPNKLRAHFDKLYLQAGSSRNKASPGRSEPQAWGNIREWLAEQEAN